MIGFCTAPSRESATESSTVSMRVGSCQLTRVPARTPFAASPAATRSQRSRKPAKLIRRSSPSTNISRSGVRAHAGRGAPRRSRLRRFRPLPTDFPSAGAFDFDRVSAWAPDGGACPRRRRILWRGGCARKVPLHPPEAPDRRRPTARARFPSRGGGIMLGRTPTPRSLPNPSERPVARTAARDRPGEALDDDPGCPPRRFGRRHHDHFHPGQEAQRRHAPDARDARSGGPRPRERRSPARAPDHRRGMLFHLRRRHQPMDPDLGVGSDGVLRGSNLRRQYRSR